jgi:hypothetical protein
LLSYFIMHVVLLDYTKIKKSYLWLYTRTYYYILWFQEDNIFLKATFSCVKAFLNSLESNLRYWQLWQLAKYWQFIAYFGKLTRATIDALICKLPFICDGRPAKLNNGNHSTNPWHLFELPLAFSTSIQQGRPLAIGANHSL